MIPAPLRQPSVTVGPSQFIPGSLTSFAPDEDDVLMGMVDPHGRAHVMGRLVNSAAPDAANDHPPDFKIEFHPHSKHLTLFQSTEEFSQQNLKCMPPDCEPWRPFALEGNYIFALIAMEAGLSSNQVDSLLKLVHCISQGTTSVTLCNDAGCHTALDRVVVQLTPFSKFEITVPYKGNDMTSPIHICPLWDWALDLLQNSSLAPHFVWDAQWLFKHDGERYECFYMEPWTGNHWWDIQFMFAMVPELAKEEGKTGYTNFKHVVWHTAFFQLLEKVAELSKVGYLHECYDKVLCWLFPLVLILSANYEELALALFKEKKMVGEKKLKSLRLCPVKNTFWSVEHSEPEQAASFEPLHSLHGGMGGKHIHGELRIVVMIHITFSNGNKMRDLTSYLRLNTLIGLDVHTEKTLGMIEDELLIFRDELKLYQSFVCHLDDMDVKDNWNFLKAHLWKHVTHDIQSKGIVCNYSAWPNEKMHGLLKDAYQDHSNGKDIAGQACIDAENEHVNNATDNDEDHNTVLEGTAKLGTPQQTRSLSDVENTNKNDQVFDGFHWKLETFLNTCLLTYGFPLDKWIQLQGMHTTYPHSSEDPGVSIFEGPLLETKTTFVQLILMFTCKVAVFEDTFQFALVQLLTARTGVHSVNIHSCEIDHSRHIALPGSEPPQEWIQTQPQVQLPTEQPSSSDSDQMLAEIQSNSSGSEQLDDLGGLLSE
ncbi:hypothetical protein F5J12DRAFT_784505 [Pisolithus orientalis]|uniref:uncharacterized protein n=1 Tax=Pisolithus orientalis TaxID=936130 RepID=UPI002225031B|nr:uncharacterized protein F5J12DRAFT_784505 [Pisolithus orientalis]KAI6000201.1 hypothetical protein F5J12DRAFT_784505 [Pisolithus orientalis]